MKDIKQFADELSDAYSTDNYVNSNWAPSIRMLRNLGFSDANIEAIIRSKWTRWAADCSNKRYGRNTSVDLYRFLHSMNDLADQVEELTKETFGGYPQ
jgi:hypothetical protein